MAATKLVLICLIQAALGYSARSNQKPGATDPGQGAWAARMECYVIGQAGEEWQPAHLTGLKHPKGEGGLTDRTGH